MSCLDNELNICLLTDNGYVMPTYVTIYSIFKNRNKKIKYNIYLLCYCVDKNNKNKLLKLNCNNFHINIIDLESNDISQYKIDNIPATPTSINKFFIPDILSEINKVLYLDGDIIVRCDLVDLFNYEVGDNYIAAVKDVEGLSMTFKKNVGYKYFNSGVMLMNLNLMRDDGIPSKLYEYRKNGVNRLMDQDALNYILIDRVLYLPFEYNVQTNVLSVNYLNNNDIYKLENIKSFWNISDDYKTTDDILNNAKIVHYTSTKPWKYFDGFGNDLWYSFYIQSSYDEIPIIRKSAYLSDIINSESYKLGSKIVQFYAKIFRKKCNNKKYDEFARIFYDFDR